MGAKKQNNNENGGGGSCNEGQRNPTSRDRQVRLSRWTGRQAHEAPLVVMLGWASSQGVHVAWCTSHSTGWWLNTWHKRFQGGVGGLDHGSRTTVQRYVKGRRQKLFLHSRQVRKQERGTQVPHFYSVQDPIPWDDTAAHSWARPLPSN